MASRKFQKCLKLFEFYFPAGLAESKTVCKITSGDVEATAEATISRTIDGMCTSEEVKQQFQALEAKLLNEIIILRQMVAKGLNLDATFFAPLSTMEYHTSPHIVPAQPNFAPSTSAPAIFFPDDAPSPAKLSKPSKTARVPELKSLYTSRPSYTQLETRADEINTMNNTIRRAGEAKIFTYFWKLENFSKHVDAGPADVTSPIFTIADHNLRAIAVFHHLNRDFLNLRIEEVSDEFLRQNKKSSIRIESSQVLNRNIDVGRHFRHKIVIMDHNVPPADIISPIFNDNSAGFAIPLSVFLSQRYSKNDTLLIRVTIYV